MSERLKRIFIAVAIGLTLGILTNFVEIVLARHGLAPSDTILDDACIGLAAALCAYSWAALLGERESRDRVKTEQDAAIRERTRIACEIHDVIAQSFVGLIYNIEAADEFLPDSSPGKESCRRALRIAREGLAESRRLVRTVRSPLTNAEDMKVAVTELVSLLIENQKIRVDCNVAGDFSDPSPEIKGQLLRILREAVTNAVKHARASELSVSLSLRDGYIRLSVQDNGCGFVPHDSNGDEAFGLTSMQERAQDLGGTLSIDSMPGNGTRIVASIPIPAKLQREATQRRAAKAASAC